MNMILLPPMIIIILTATYYTKIIRKLNNSNNNKNTAIINAWKNRKKDVNTILITPFAYQRKAKVKGPFLICLYLLE